MIQRIAGPASRSTTFSGRRRLVILDEADNLHGTADRGGAAAMLRLVRETGQPVLLIANEYYEIDKALRDAAKGIQFRSLRATTVAQALRVICQAEGVECEADALMLIAERAGGDMRSAINDLQAAAEGVQIVSGSQQALDLVAKLFLNPGDTVVVPYDATRLDKLKLTTNIVQIVSQLAITAASLKAVGAF